jgi:hypothetical protein
MCILISTFESTDLTALSDSWRKRYFYFKISVGIYVQKFLEKYKHKKTTPHKFEVQRRTFFQVVQTKFVEDNGFATGIAEIS